MNGNIKGRRPYSEKELRNMLNKAPYLMWIKDEQGRYRFVNEEFLELFDLKIENVIGIKDKDIFLNNTNITIDSDDFFYDELYKYIEKKVSVEGNVKWIEAYTWPLYESSEKEGWIAGVATDITEEKLIDDFLCDIICKSITDNDIDNFLENLTYYDETLYQGEAGKDKCRKLAYIFIKNELLGNIKAEFDKRVISEKYMNLLLDVAADFYGVLDVDYEKKEFKIKQMYIDRAKDKELLDIIRNLGYNEHDGERVCEVNGHPIKSNLSHIKDKNNEDRFIEFRWYIVNRGQVIVTANDKTIEKQLSDYNKELQKHIGLEKMKSEFFANLSHEFKTPINIITTACQLIKSIGINGGNVFEKYVSIMKQNSYRLSKLINNLIDTRRIDNGYYSLEKGNYNIVAIINKLADSMEEYLLSKKRKFIFESACDEIVVSCDPEMIERIMMNLISNAVKYTNEGNTIKISIKNDNKCVFITVSNNGEKLEKESIDIIFDRFVRADNILTRRCEGSGIGLYIVKSLVELHGGNIWVDVDEQDITKFTFSMSVNNANSINSNENDLKRDILGKEVRCNIEFSDIY